MLFSQYFAPLCLIAHRIVKNQDTAKDIVQDVFVRLWTNREQVHIQSSLEAYLKQSVRNASIDHQRKGYERKRTQIENLESIPTAAINLQAETVDLDIENKETTRLIDHAISQLPERCRLVFVLSRHEGLTYNEIAKKLEISPKTVENQMTKALRSLRLSLSSLLSWGVILMFYLFFFD